MNAAMSTLEKQRIALLQKVAEEGRQPFLSTIDLETRQNDILHRSALAFLAGLVSDQSVRAKLAWSLPHRLIERLGVEHLADPRVRDADAVARAIGATPALHRFPTAISRYIASLAAGWSHLDEVPTTNAWRGRTAAETRKELIRIPGIGPKKASLGVLLLVNDFDSDLRDLPNSGLAIDRHVDRVLSRFIGMYGDQAPPDNDRFQHFDQLAKASSNSFPAALSTPLWRLGATVCRPKSPQCTECPLSESCSWLSSSRK